MSDIVTELRDKACSGKVPNSLSAQAADEIERLRSRVRFFDNVIRSGDVAALTEAERWALERGICSLTGVEDLSGRADPMDDACTIRGLLKRLGGQPQPAISEAEWDALYQGTAILLWEGHTREEGSTASRNLLQIAATLKGLRERLEARTK